MPLTIRRGQQADTAVVAEYNRLLAEESEGKILDRDTLAKGVRAVLVNPIRGTYYLAELDGESSVNSCSPMNGATGATVGSGGFRAFTSGADARRRGVFRALYEHAEATARAEPDVIGLRLYVERNNGAAQQTYLRLGMQQTDYFVLEKCPL